MFNPSATPQYGYGGGYSAPSAFTTHTQGSKSKMKLLLSLNAAKLSNIGGVIKEKTDPFAVVTILGSGIATNTKVIGKTEVIYNTIKPDWAETFVLDYVLGMPLQVNITVFHEGRHNKHVNLGNATFNIESILGSVGNTKASKLKHGGILYAHVEKYKGSGFLRLKLNGKNFKNTDGLFNKSDPFYEIKRKDYSSGGMAWNTVFRSQVVKDNLNPIWPEEKIDLGKICNGDKKMELTFNVLDFEHTGKHILMGSFTTSVGELEKKPTSGSGYVMTKGRKTTGQVFVQSATIEQKIKKHSDMNTNAIASQMAAFSMNDSAAGGYPGAFVPPKNHNAMYSSAPATSSSFLDYIHGGCRMNLCVAIDFTGSNGNPIQPGTLHYLYQDGRKNDYENAILGIGNVIMNFNSDQQIPVWGFGAKYGGVVRHCFQCGNSAKSNGIQGVLQSYRQTFKSGLIMSGPTVFNEVIFNAAQYAKTCQDESSRSGTQSYTVLLLLTDGSVSDVNSTMQCLDAVSDSPLSIVIVGIGNADFSGMRFLDDRRSYGKPDMVDFVPFSTHRNNISSLTSATLSEIPGQLEGYFHRRGIMPLPPVQHTDNDIYVEAANTSNFTFDFSGTDGVIRVSEGCNPPVQNSYGNPNNGVYNPSVTQGMQNQVYNPGVPSAPGMTNQQHGGLNNMQPNMNTGNYNPAYNSSMTPGMQNNPNPSVPGVPSAPGMTNQQYGGMNNMQPNMNSGNYNPAYNPSMTPGMQNNPNPSVPGVPSAPGMTNQQYGGMNNMQPNMNSGNYNPAYNSSMTPGMQNNPNPSVPGVPSAPGMTNQQYGGMNKMPYGNTYGNRG